MAACLLKGKVYLLKNSRNVYLLFQEKHAFEKICNCNCTITAAIHRLMHFLSQVELRTERGRKTAGLKKNNKSKVGWHP